MKKINRTNSKEQALEILIEKTLRTGGFLFPETAEELKEFELIFGNTNVILPEELQNPAFLNFIKKKSTKSKFNSSNSLNRAMAARAGSDFLPAEIQKKMEKDRELAKSIKKKKK